MLKIKRDCNFLFVVGRSAAVGEADTGGHHVTVDHVMRATIDHVMRRLPFFYGGRQNGIQV